MRRIGALAIGGAECDVQRVDFSHIVGGDLVDIEATPVLKGFEHRLPNHTEVCLEELCSIAPWALRSR